MLTLTDTEESQDILFHASAICQSLSLQTCKHAGKGGGFFPGSASNEKLSECGGDLAVSDWLGRAVVLHNVALVFITSWHIGAGMGLKASQHRKLLRERSTRCQH